VDDTSAELVDRWRQGDQRAAERLFEGYAARLVGLARSRLSGKLARRLDAEDVVQSAFRSFFDGVHQGQYEVSHPGDLWRLLVSITLHKLYRQARRHAAGKRALDREQPFGATPEEWPVPVQQLAGEPSPGEAGADLRGSHSPPGRGSLAGGLTVTSAVVPAVGSSFEVLDDLATSAIAGAFTGLAEGATFTVKVGTTTMTFKITYKGGIGNDVVLTRIS
jgi:DNA-directed RNA polymerase specialized sigma24 family protein